ncbi:MAG: Immune inhibitor peptidase, partial [Frankiales bacterium]|nr:Immune inhibitor peptidase [Frankiales bacterium]
DRYLDTSKAKVAGITRKNVTTKSLDATINLNNPAVEAKPGAAPNGADYVTLYNGPRAGKALQSLSFSGAKTLAPQPLLWTSTSATPDPLATAPVLWSGNRSNLDAAAVTSVAVPVTDPTLTFNEQHLAEEGYDYAYTIVSTDGGATYTPLANSNTADGPLGPALNGDSAGFATQTFDLTPYAGKTVLLGFRYVSDGGTNDGGWYVDDVKVGSTVVSDGSSLAPFQSPTQVKATTVHNWFIRLVGLDAHHNQARFARYSGKFDVALKAADLRGFAAYPLVVAIVSYDEPTEQVQQYAPYVLKLNGATLAGGS